MHRRPCPRPALVAGRSTGLDWIPANRTEPPGPREHPRLDGPSIIAACEAELRRLRTDHIDLLQLHWPDRCGGVVDIGRCQPGKISEP